MDCENCRHLTVVGLHDTGPRSQFGSVTPDPAGAEPWPVTDRHTLYNKVVQDQL